jgi:HEAT repeat protein
VAESERLAALAELGRPREAEHLQFVRLLLATVAEQDPSPPVRKAAQEALREAGGPVSEGLEMLGRQLTHRNASVREMAAWTLCVARSQDLLTVLRQRLRSETEPAVRVALLHAVAALGTAPDVMVVLPFLEAREKPVRLAALRTISMLAGADANPYLVRGLTDPAEEVRSLALGVLGAGGWASVKELLTRMGRSAIPWQTEAAVVVLGGTKNPEAVAILAPLRQHGSGRVRELAERALSQLARAGIAAADELLRSEPRAAEEGKPGAATGGPASLEWHGTMRLSKLGHELAVEAPDARQEDVRAWAGQLLAEGRAERWNEVAQKLGVEAVPAVAAYLVTCLGRLGANAAVPYLLPYLSHPDGRVRANTVEALRLLARADQAEALLPCLEDPDNRVRANAIVALANHPAVDPVARLSAMAGSPREEMQLSALYVAGVLGTPEAAEAVRHLASSPVESVRSNARSLPLLTGAGRRAPRPARSFAWPAAVLLAGVALAWGVGGRRTDSSLLELPRARVTRGEARAWAPGVPAARDYSAVSGRATGRQPLVLPPALMNELKNLQGSSTSPATFGERWTLLYRVLFLLPKELRADIASLAEMALLRGAARSRPEESCTRLDEWLRQAWEILSPLVKAAAQSAEVAR